MKTLLAFAKKEIMEQVRSGRLMILGVLFVFLGILNPATAKMTPWLLEIMADSLEGSGMIVTGVTVSALDSWVQFFKNMPLGLIAFILLESAVFTKEYGTGTLLLSLTKGLKRYKVVVSKSAVLALLWTGGYWLCFGITYAYTAYFWDNSVAKNIAFSAVCWWVFGIWVLALMVLFSTVANANTGVLVGMGGVVLVSAIFGFLPKLEKYVPTFLTDGNSLIYGAAEAKAYAAALAVAALMSAACFALSIVIFNKKQL